jgi:hypothetical protein
LSAGGTKSSAQHRSGGSLSDKGVSRSDVTKIDDICGARVVDKSVGTRQLFRLELWFKRKDLSVADELKKRMNEHLGPAAEKACKWEMREH